MCIRDSLPTVRLSHRPMRAPRGRGDHRIWQLPRTAESPRRIALCRPGRGPARGVRSPGRIRPRAPSRDAESPRRNGLAAIGSGPGFRGARAHPEMCIRDRVGYHSGQRGGSELRLQVHGRQNQQRQSYEDHGAILHRELSTPETRLYFSNEMPSNINRLVRAVKAKAVNSHERSSYLQKSLSFHMRYC